MTKTEKADPRFLTSQEVADILRVNIEYIRDEIKAGNLRAYKVGRAFIIEDKDLEDYIKARVVIANE